MTFEWDPIKNKANLEKHGIAFEEAMLIFEGPVLTQVDNRIAYGEVREISVGEIFGLATIVVVHTDRNGKQRLISARLASTKERKQYRAYLEKATR